jgi:hypothetical protein
VQVEQPSASVHIAQHAEHLRLVASSGYLAHVRLAHAALT